MPIPEILAQEFQSLEEVRKAIQNFVIDLGESFKVSHADRSRYIVTCQDITCKFSIEHQLLKGQNIELLDILLIHAVLSFIKTFDLLILFPFWLSDTEQL
jgi:MuDR family transposase.